MLLLLFPLCLVLLLRVDPNMLLLERLLKRGRSAAALPMIIPMPGSKVVTIVRMDILSIFLKKGRTVRSRVLDNK